MIKAIMNKLLIVISIVAITLLASCSKKILPTSTIKRDYGLERFDFTYLQTKSKIKFDSEDRSITSAASIRMKKDSVIWISITPIFGMEAARGVITQDTIVFLDRVNKEVYRYNYKGLSEMINFDIDFMMLQSILLGNQVFDFEQRDKFSKSSGDLAVNQVRDRFALLTLADSKIRKVKTVEVTEEPAGNTMRLSFEEYQTVEAQAFPFIINIIINNKLAGRTETTEVDMTHSRVEVINTPISFPFSVPSKYEN
ncbi:MAG: hypothetical protein ACJAT1_000863 [Marivirga sp.]|jgi:hypothetical protein